MDTKRILLIGGNFYPEPTGIGKYNGEMIDWLANHGFDCTVVTSYPYYPHWKLQTPYTKQWFWYNKEIRVTEGENINGENNSYITVYRCPHYVPENPNGKKRMLLDLTFGISSLLKITHLLLKKRYDIVITVVPPFHLGLLGILYKRIKKAKFLYHVQDLQIEAARDLQMIKSQRMLRSLFGMERYILDQADLISSISDGMIRKIEEKSQKEVQFFPNWSNIKLFHPIVDKAGLKKKFGFTSKEQVILYSGAIGEKQGLDCIIDAASLLRDKEHFRFVICGSGPYKEKLMQLTQKKDLKNVTFLPLQPLELFNEFLNMADVHLILQKAGASDLVMPSKLTNILAVGGLSIITAEPGSSLYETVEKNHIGLLVPSEDSVSLARGIEKALCTDHSGIRKNSREYAENFLSIDGIMSRYFESV